MSCLYVILLLPHYPPKVINCDVYKDALPMVSSNLQSVNHPLVNLSCWAIVVGDHTRLCLWINSICDLTEFSLKKQSISCSFIDPLRYASYSTMRLHCPKWTHHLTSVFRHPLEWVYPHQTPEWEKNDYLSWRSRHHGV